MKQHPASHNPRSLLTGLGIGALALLWLWLELQKVALHAPVTPSAAWAYVCQLVTPPAAVLGLALLPAALAVMAPCLLQMALVLVTAITGLTASDASALRRPAMAFGASFLAVYLAAALAIGALGQHFGQYAALLNVLGGVLIFLLGLAVLRVLPAGTLGGCRGPRWLVLSGRASLRRPAAAGVAFAVYCVGCCGPFLASLALLAAGSGAFWQGTLLVLVFALLMAALLLLPIIALPASRRFSQLLHQHGATIAPIAGAALIAFGVILTVAPILAWAVMF
jgi:cytochrome c-type biogenesis protein